MLKRKKEQSQPFQPWITMIIFHALLFQPTSQMWPQKIEREYHSNLRIKYEWQADENGVKNGYFKSFTTDGMLFEKGHFSKGVKNGIWTTYGIIQGFPTEISSTMEYVNGKMNGQYKQWCWEKSKKYLCGDYLYRNDEEVKAKQFFSNGKLQYERDIDNGLYKEWFEDGSPSTETIEGRKIVYDMNGNDYYGVKRIIRSISFDSLEHNYSFYYEYNTSSK
ncbi:MAG: hypothetical protein ACKO6L_00470, partial [Flavobacteriales bacterium]